MGQPSAPKRIRGGVQHITGGDLAAAGDVDPARDRCCGFRRQLLADNNSRQRSKGMLALPRNGVADLRQCLSDNAMVLCQFVEVPLDMTVRQRESFGHCSHSPARHRGRLDP